VLLPDEGGLRPKYVGGNIICIYASDTEDNLQKEVYLLYNISKKYNLEIAAKKDENISFRWNGSPKNKNYYK